MIDVECLFSFMIDVECVFQFKTRATDRDGVTKLDPGQASAKSVLGYLRVMHIYIIV